MVKQMLPRPQCAPPLQGHCSLKLTLCYLLPASFWYLAQSPLSKNKTQFLRFVCLEKEMLVENKAPVNGVCGDPGHYGHSSWTLENSVVSYSAPHLLFKSVIRHE